MKKQYTEPQTLILHIETEGMICVSPTGTNVQGLGVDNTGTDQPGRSREKSPFDDEEEDF